MTDTPIDQADDDSVTAVATAASITPTADQLEQWMGQNRKLLRRSQGTVIAIAVAFAIAVGSAMSNVLVLNKLDERCAANRKVILGIEQSVDNTEKLVAFTGRLESPDTLAENDRKTQQLLDAFALRVDCNTRLALRDAVVDVFGETAAAEYEDKIEALCVARGSTPSSGTTTTSAPPPTSAAPPAASIVPNG